MASVVSMALTENGALALSTTGSKCLDFFTRITRNSLLKDYVSAFCDAWMENPETTLKILMNMRDVRGGKGEKLIPQVLMVILKHTKPIVYLENVKKFIDLGYWKDLLVICETDARFKIEEGVSIDEHYFDLELEFFAKQLQEDLIKLNEAEWQGEKAPIGISLCAKWAPTEKTHYDHHPMFFTSRIQKIMQFTPKEYRKALTRLRNHIKVLETLMSTGQLDKIDFSHIPSVAHRKTRIAFMRDSNADGIISEERTKLKLRYQDYLNELKSNNTKSGVKINFKGTHPHELVKYYLSGENNHLEPDDTIEAQWKALQNDIYSKGSFKKTMAVCDVSGSMNGLPLQVAISLSILVASCTEGTFHNKLITFSQHPEYFNLTGETLKEKVEKVSKMSWGMNTDLMAVFDLILNSAQMYGLTQDQMIETLFIFTDMQFDEATATNGTQTNLWETTYQTIQTKYKSLGYTVPKIVFWNLRTSDAKTLPVEETLDGVALLSGFSAELLKCVLNREKFDPMSVLLHVLEPYDVVINDSWSLEPIDLSDIDLTKLQLAIEKSKIKSSFKGKKNLTNSNSESDIESDQIELLAPPDN